MATEPQQETPFTSHTAAPPSYGSVNPKQQVQQSPAPSSQQEQRQLYPLQEVPRAYQPWPQGQVFQPASEMNTQRPAQYIVAPQIGGPGYPFPTVAVAPPAPYEAPHDFLILAMVTTIICGILNLISLAFGLPAIMLSVVSINFKGNKNYPEAKNYGKYSLVMSILNILFTLCVALLVTGLTMGIIVTSCLDSYDGYC